jgi:putative transposase
MKRLSTEFDFITITCLYWIPLLQDDKYKDIIIDSLIYLVKSQRIRLFAFVIMPDHMHLLWRIIGENSRQDVQRDFLKFTAQQIIKDLRNTNQATLGSILVEAKDRKYQVWERNSLTFPVWTSKALWQKINYIHQNPVVAELCMKPEEYRYSSSRFYKHYCNNEWSFLERVQNYI